ncbi:hypothetical protein [Tardiphaga sp. P9-11]|uniref:hypothetical protein n=1 Tax=Tardiphaga sp. P9-11 TaxID=2024614 RepID=UPI001FEF3579|nr:hypothetical protein [Tardiphaga sp. P9-11]
MKDDQSRYIEAAVDGVLIGCVSRAQRQSAAGPKFDYKLAWLKRLNAHASKLLKSGAPVVIAGDFDVVPMPFRHLPTKSWDKDAPVQPESKPAYQSSCQLRRQPSRFFPAGGPTSSGAMPSGLTRLHVICRGRRESGCCAGYQKFFHSILLFAYDAECSDN